MLNFSPACAFKPRNSAVTLHIQQLHTCLCFINLLTAGGSKSGLQKALNLACVSDEDSVTVLCVQAPDCSVVGVGEKILLFRHQPASELLLQRLMDHEELQDGDLIEVIIAGQRSTA